MGVVGLVALAFGVIIALGMVAVAVNDVLEKWCAQMADAGRSGGGEPADLFVPPWPPAHAVRAGLVAQRPSNGHVGGGEPARRQELRRRTLHERPSARG